MVLERLQPEPVAVVDNFVAVRVKLRNNISLISGTLYIHTPLDDASRAARMLCQEIVESARIRGETVLLGGDFNTNINSPFLMRLRELLPNFLAPSDNPLRRASGKAKVIDFVLGSTTLEAVSFSKVLNKISDHCPILCTIKLQPLRLPRTQPCSTSTRKAILDILQRAEMLPPR